MTIAANFEFFYVQRANGYRKFQFWDHPGNYGLNPVNIFVFQGANVVIYVFDVTDQMSLTETINQIKEIRQDPDCKFDPDCQGYLVGNQIDLPREVRRETGQEAAKELGLKYLEVTATDHESV